MRAALHDGATVVNVIEYDPEADYSPPAGLTLDVVADGERVGPRWRVTADGYAPPFVHELTATPDTITADGTDVATVTYRNTHDDAPASVVFTVDGTDTDPEPLDADGRARLELTADALGTITVEADVLTITVEAT